MIDDDGKADDTAVNPGDGEWLPALPFRGVKNDTGDEVELRFVEREGNVVYVRESDPCDPPAEIVPVYDGEQIVQLVAISHVGVHSSAYEAGAFLFSARLVPNDGEPVENNARVLRFGEHDDGRRVHVRPGSQVTFNPVAELMAIDAFEARDADGYVPLTPVLFSWFAVAPDVPDERTRFLLAAARRLDRAQSLFEQASNALDVDTTNGPATRRAMFELIGTIELAVVSLSRAMDMCMKAKQLIGVPTPVPEAISSRTKAVTEIRNAYEHIEDRALGRVRDAPRAEALDIFGHAALIGDRRVEYGRHSLGLDTDAPEIVAELRNYLLNATTDASADDRAEGDVTGPGTSR